MEYSLFIRPKAETQIKEAFFWYENQQKGLGQHFINELEKVLDLVTLNPFLSEKKYKDIRCAFVSRFPYGIFYLIKEKCVVVLAVFHLSRDPRGWRIK